MPETIRTFIAFELPDAVLSALGRAQNDLKNLGLKAKWVRVQSIHLTLKFLGDIQADQVDSVAHQLAAAAVGGRLTSVDRPEPIDAR